MLRRLRNSDGNPSGAVRLLALLLIVALAAAAAPLVIGIVADLLHWALPALF